MTEKRGHKIFVWTVLIGCPPEGSSPKTAITPVKHGNFANLAPVASSARYELKPKNQSSLHSYMKSMTYEAFWVSAACSNTPSDGLGMNWPGKIAGKPL
jgi:hypothetical protein